MITDFWFYPAALAATFLIGMSKSGFLPGISSLGVPLMALWVSPVQAAAIQLPLLIATDWIGIWNYRRSYDWTNLRILIPSAFVGAALGTYTATWVTDAHIRILVGVIGIAFTLTYWWSRWRRRREAEPTKPEWARGMLWGSIASYTSFFAHAGGPPFSVYILPQKLPNMLYAGTMIMFFSLVNALKIPGYLMLGQLSWTTLITSLVLFPVAWGATLVGIWLVKTVPQEPFYRLLYTTQLLVSLKLVWDGLTKLMWG